MKSMEVVVQDCKKDSCKELFSKTVLKSQLRLDNFKFFLKSQLELYFLNSLIRQSSDLFWNWTLPRKQGGNTWA